MLENQKRSKLFSFALKAQENFGKLAGIAILWSIWALTFSSYELIFIAKVLISITAFGLGIIAPLIDFNESHASNPLWTGHARYHLVWQVCALAATGYFVVFLLWIAPSFSNLLIAITLVFIWLISFWIALLSMSLYGGNLNDVNGVPPVHIKLLGKSYELDRNVQGISGSTLLTIIAAVLVFI